MSIQEFQMELEVSYEVFFDKEAQNNYGFGIYSCKPVNYTRELATDYQGKVSIQGTSRRLVKGERYDAKFSGTYTHAKHGVFYKIVEIAPERLNTVTEQDKFLRVILTDAQFDSLKKAYPDKLLVDMILADQIDVKKTKGIKEKSLAKIKSEVQLNAELSVLIAKLDTLNLSTNAIDKLMNHFRTAEAVIRAIDEDIYNLCAVKQFGFLSVDKVAIERGDVPTNEKRITACLMFLLKKDNKEGHTWTPKSALIESATELLNIDRSLIEDRLNSLKESKDFYLSNERVAISWVREQEVEVYSHLKRIQDSYVTVNNINEKVIERIEDVEYQQDFLFTGEQYDAIASSVHHGVSIINGLAGSGKSATVKGLIDSLGTDNYMSACLSGKAVQVLSKRGIKASTIHRMLGYTGGSFAHNETSQLDYDIVVIDEMSMVDVSLFLSVLKAIPNGAKLIIVGDSGQLSSIGFGDILRDLLATKAFPTYELTQVHRQAAKSGILALANSVRAGNQIMPYNSSGKEVYGELMDQTAISYTNKDSIPFDILKIAESYKVNIKRPEDIVDFQVVVPNREKGNLSVRSMNIELQKIFNDMDKPFLSRNGYNFREGDKVIAQGNTYKLSPFRSTQEYIDNKQEVELVGEEEKPKGNTDVYNGTMGIVKAIIDKAVLIQFEDIKGLIAIEQSGMDKLDMAYAATVHRLQGSSVPDIVFALDYGAFKLLSRQLVYTALTRASRKGVVLCENNAMYQAISFNASEIRRTFLGDIIRQKYVE